MELAHELTHCTDGVEKLICESQGHYHTGEWALLAVLVVLLFSGLIIAGIVQHFKETP